MNTLTTLRDWWHQPVTHRLDRLIRFSEPREVTLGPGKIDQMPQFSEDGHWSFDMPVRSKR